MSSLPDFLSSGTPARLFPVVADTRREERTLSIFLAVLTQVPEFYAEILGSVGVRTGTRTRVSAYTEVGVGTETGASDRPDGLLLVETGRTTWSAFVEAKVGRSALDPDQVERYLKLARDNGIDAVITISNDFAARPNHSPVAGAIPRLRQLTGKVRLYHWSWAYLATCCEVLAYQGIQESPEQDYLVKQLNDYLAHPTTGVERFTQMGPEWRNIVQLVSTGATLTRNTPGLEDVVASWFAEERDLCLHMTSHLNRPVTVQIERKHAGDQKLRIEAGIAAFAESQALTSVLRVPDCASDITVRADLARRTVAVSMALKARTDRKSTRARVNWLLGMLKADDPRLRIQAYWPGRAAPTSESVTALREDPGRLQSSNPSLLPHAFDVLLTEEPSGKRFSGPKAFIEDLERIVPEFYDLVAVTLKAWRPPPPQPVARVIEVPEAESTDGETDVAEETSTSTGVVAAAALGGSSSGIPE